MRSPGPPRPCFTSLPPVFLASFMVRAPPPSSLDRVAASLHARRERLVEGGHAGLFLLLCLLRLGLLGLGLLLLGRLTLLHATGHGARGGAGRRTFAGIAAAGGRPRRAHRRPSCCALRPSPLRGLGRRRRLRGSRRRGCCRLVLRPGLALALVLLLRRRALPLGRVDHRRGLGHRRHGHRQDHRKRTTENRSRYPPHLSALLSPV